MEPEYTPFLRWIVCYENKYPTLPIREVTFIADESWRLVKMNDDGMVVYVSNDSTQFKNVRLVKVRTRSHHEIFFGPDLAQI